MQGPLKGYLLVPSCLTAHVKRPGTYRYLLLGSYTSIVVHILVGDPRSFVNYMRLPQDPPTLPDHGPATGQLPPPSTHNLSVRVKGSRGRRLRYTTGSSKPRTRFRSARQSPTELCITESVGKRFPVRFWADAVRPNSRRRHPLYSTTPRHAVRCFVLLADMDLGSSQATMVS